MAVDIFVNPTTGDIEIDENNLLRLTSNIAESSRQQMTISLSTYKGEMFWATEAGIPYLRNDNNDVHALGEKSKRFLDALIQNDVLNRENIIGISSYSSEVDVTSGKLSVIVNAITEEGEVNPVTISI